MRRLLGLLAVAALVPCGAPAHAAPPRTRVWVFTTDRPRVPQFEAWFSRRPGRNGVFAYAVLRGRTVEAWDMAYAPDLMPSVNDSPGCPDAVCVPVSERLTGGGSEGLLYTGERAGWYRIVVATDEMDATVTAGRGWTLSRARSPGFRHLLSTHADGPTAEWGPYAVSHFESAELPGGRWGSIAFAQPPCGSRGGTGGVRLTGGYPVLRLPCPKPGIPPEYVAVALAGTAWQLTGPATGAGGYPVRLAVIDLPPGT